MPKFSPLFQEKLKTNPKSSGSEEEITREKGGENEKTRA